MYKFLYACIFLHLAPDAHVIASSSDRFIILLQLHGHSDNISFGLTTFG